MFKHLLVPLDGSRMAESALQPALYMAQALGATVTILHVMEHDPPEEIHGEPHLTSIEDAYAYLEALEARQPPGATVHLHAHPNPEHDVARSIVEHAAELGVDLIVLCTHGRGSLRRWLFGTIAQQVIAQGRTPVMVVHPTAIDTPAYVCSRVLVPLDGDPEHEVALVVAAEVARDCGASLDLVVVIPTPGTLSLASSATAVLLPATTRAALDFSQAAAAAYLARLADGVAASGVASTTRVRRGDPIAMITLEAEESAAGLIVMATHPKSHMDAFWSGSVAPQVMERTHLPIILVPAHAPA